MSRGKFCMFVTVCYVRVVGWIGPDGGGDGESISVFANMVAQTGRESSEKLREAALKAEVDKINRGEA